MVIRCSGLPTLQLVWRRSVRSPRGSLATIQFLPPFNARDAEKEGPQVFQCFRDANAAMHFLRRFKHDYFAMSALRNLLAESPAHCELSRLTSEEVLAKLAHLIGSGELLVGCDWENLAGGGSGSDETEVSKPAAPAAAPVADRKTKEEAPEPPSFPASVDGKNLAAALVAAAATGAPFSPQCTGTPSTCPFCSNSGGTA